MMMLKHVQCLWPDILLCWGNPEDRRVRTQWIVTQNETIANPKTSQRKTAAWHWEAQQPLSWHSRSSTKCNEREKHVKPMVMLSPTLSTVLCFQDISVKISPNSLTVSSSCLPCLFILKSHLTTRNFERFSVFRVRTLVVWKLNLLVCGELSWSHCWNPCTIVTKQFILSCMGFLT